MEAINFKNLDLYIPQFENMTSLHSKSSRDLFPTQSLTSALIQNFQDGPDEISE